MVSRPVTTAPSRAGSMRISELWRYPVKSLAGESLPAAELREDGIAGDRIVQVYDGPGDRVITARARPKLLGLRGTLGPDGEPLIDGRPWSSPESARAVAAAAGPQARLERHAGPGRFDVLPLMVATESAVAVLGVDRRRLRPNIVIAGSAGLAERSWPGRRLRLGEAVIEAARLRPRCVMTTFDPDTQAQDLGVLRRIHDEFDGSFALDCSVVQPGRIRVGDPVELL